jgi:DNA-directed RNA polymerase specialized sigma subunit
MGEMMSDDMGRVREYARHGSEEAFGTLVSRYVSLVNSVAMRHVPAIRTSATMSR